MERLTKEAISFLVRRTSIARTAIVEHIEGQGKKRLCTNGKIHCPVCKAEERTLRYTYAGCYNGHIHAQCLTPDCVSWME